MSSYSPADLLVLKKNEMYHKLLKKYPIKSTGPRDHFKKSSKCRELKTEQGMIKCLKRYSRSKYVGASGQRLSEQTIKKRQNRAVKKIKSPKKKSSKKQSVKRRSSKRRSVKKRSVKKRSVKKRSVKKRSVKKRSVKKRSVKKRLSKRK